MTTSVCAVDIKADLQAEDETGYVWAYLRRALRPDLIRPGARVIAGSSGARVVAEVVDIVDGPGDQIVHLRLLRDSVRELERERLATGL